MSQNEYKPHVWRCPRGLHLELMVIMSYLIGELGTELGSSRKVVYTLNHLSNPSPTVFTHITCWRNDQMSRKI